MRTPVKLFPIREPNLSRSIDRAHHRVPGISFSPDKMLQARLFSYGDTQRYRLGVNFNHIPVNAPRCPYQSYHRDGKMRVDGNLGATLSYHPNSAGLWDNQPDLAEPPLQLSGNAAHYDHRVDDDHWEQPGNLFRLMMLDVEEGPFLAPASETSQPSTQARRRTSVSDYFPWINSPSGMSGLTGINS